MNYDGATVLWCAHGKEEDLKGRRPSFNDTLSIKNLRAVFITADPKCREKIDAYKKYKEEYFVRRGEKIFEWYEMVVGLNPLD